MSSPPFRPLNAKEKQLLQHLLSEDFPGRNDLMNQLKDAVVRVIDDDGCLEFQIQSGNDATAPIPIREGEFKDTDGGMAHVLLHTWHGRIYELEFYKEDGLKVSRFPDVSEVETLPPTNNPANCEP